MEISDRNLSLRLTLPLEVHVKQSNSKKYDTKNDSSPSLS